MCIGLNLKKNSSVCLNNRKMVFEIWFIGNVFIIIETETESTGAQD